MTGPLTTSNVTDILIEVLPGIIGWIRKFHSDNGRLPTDNEVIAGLHTDEMNVLDKANTWLANHPEFN